MNIGSTARDLRLEFGLTQRAAATRLGISYVYLCNIEKGNAQPSSDILDKFHQLFGVDLYVYTWCRQGDANRLPTGLRDVSKKLTNEWSKVIERRKQEFKGGN